MLEKPTAKQQQIILDCLADHDGLTKKELARATGIQEKSLGATLSKMVLAGYLKRVVSKEVFKSEGMLRRVKLSVTTFYLKN